MKKIISWCMIICFLLCSCGKDSLEVADTVSKKVIQSADEYEVEWVDTSKLALMDWVLASNVDSKLYFIQSILVSRDENGRMEHKYEEISYDMISGEWSESKEIPAEDEINRLGFGTTFQMAPDGKWYFSFSKWNKELKCYDNTSISRLTQDGGIEDIEIPDDLADEKLEIDSFEIRNDGKICIKVYPESKYDGTSLPEDMNVILYDPGTENFEYGGDLLMGQRDYLSIEEDYFYRSVAGGKCGYAVKTPDTGDVTQREIFCAGETPEGGWVNDSIFFVYDTCDVGNNLYVLNTGGIYGGYYKDSELKNIVPASILDGLDLSKQYDRDGLAFISDFWRGAETEYADFYVLITDSSDMDHVKTKLAHIKKKQK